MDDLNDYEDQEAMFIDDDVIQNEEMTSYLQGCQGSNSVVISIVEDETLTDFEKRQKINQYRINASYVAEEFYGHLFDYGVLSRGIIDLINNLEEHHIKVKEDYEHFGVTIGNSTEKGIEVFFHGKLAYLIQNVNVDFILTSSGIDPEEVPDFQILAGYLQRPEHYKVIRDVHIHSLLVKNDLFE